MARRPALVGFLSVAAMLVATAAAGTVPPAAAHAARPVAGARLTTWALAHRALVVHVAGRRVWHVGATAAAANRSRFGVRTPGAVVRTFRPGGVILFGDNVATVAQVRRFTTGLQRVAASAGYRLLVMTDQEGGRVRRLPGAVARNQPSAASYDGDATRAGQDARRVGAAMRAMHVLVDLAPVADVNTVGAAGVIGDRSFGSTPDLVSRMVRAQVCGYHAGGVATTLKHWPGHGSTRVDSHQSLPVLTLPVRRWESVHLPPFRVGIAAGTDLVMVGHLAYPALDPSRLPATLSRTLTWQWLRERLGFRGVIVTDSLTMGALRGYGGSGRLAVRASRAGADLLLTPADPRAAARALVGAVRDRRVTRATLAASVARVRQLEDRLGLVPGPGKLGSC